MIKYLFTFNSKFYEYVGVLLLAIAGNFCYNLYHTIAKSFSLFGQFIALISFDVALTLIYSIAGGCLLYFSHVLDVVNIQ